MQYQGSKRNLADAILQFVPKDLNCLVEPFAGSAAISIAAAAHKMARSYWINDFNKPLTDLLSSIVENPAQIAESYEKIWDAQHHDSVGHFYKVREEFNQTSNPSLFLYLVARCVKGAVRYNASGQFNQSPDKRRFGTRPKTMSNSIHGVSNLLKGKAKFSSLDYRDVLKETTISDLVYLDPPYQGVCGDKDSRYFARIEHDDFVLALENLNRQKVSYIVSYDGRTGEKVFGEKLPKSLNLVHMELEAGRSSQSTLLGRDEITHESLYLSYALIQRLDGQKCNEIQQLPLMQRANFYA